MTKRFDKLTRPVMRSLAPGQKIMEHGIRYEKVSNGDARFSIDVMVDRGRIHRVLGMESEGVTRQQAEEAIEQLRTDSRHRRLNLPSKRKTPLTFREAALQYLERLENSGGKNLVTKRRHLNHKPKDPAAPRCDYLIQFFSDKPLDDVSTFEINRYKKWRETAGATNGTINRELATLTHFMGLAREWGWTKNHPSTKKMKEQISRTVFITQSQAERLLQEAKRDDNPHIYLFCLIGLHTGMRLMEILSIRLEHIDTKARKIFLPKTKTGPATQEITHTLADYLKSHIADCKDDQIWLFPCIGSNKSKSGHVTNIRKPYRRVVAAAGLDPDQVVRHTLRHTFCTHLVHGGVDVPTAKRLSRHKTTAVFERYVKEDPEHLQAAMDKLESRLLLFKPKLEIVNEF